VLLAIDGQHRTLDVHNWRQSLDAKHQARVRIVRGETQIKPDQRYKMTRVEHSKRDEKVRYEGGLELYNLNVDVFKTDLAGRFRASPDKPGAWYVTADCLSEGQFYLKQVVNEQQVLIRGKDGRWKAVWKERDSTCGLDYWDTEVYSSAAAQMIVDSFDGEPGWDASKWPGRKAEGETRNAERGTRKAEEIGAR